MSRFAMRLLCVSLVGCSAVVAPEQASIRCRRSDGGPDPCPRGSECIAGACARAPWTDGGCNPEAEELCDGRDNNCDDLIDEMHDLDGDGVTWCGGGIQETADCDDHDPAVHPAFVAAGVVQAAPERCDGADNDCDGSTDEDDGTETLCEPNEACIDRRCVNPDDCTAVGCGDAEYCDVSVQPPTCVPRESGCTDESCAPLGCDPSTGECVALAVLGAPCSGEAMCASGLTCIYSAALRIGMSLPARVCGRACCGNADCTRDGGVCWTSGSGARSCVTKSMLGLGPTEELGFSACASEPDCPGSDVCAISEPLHVAGRTSLRTMVCDDPVGAGDRWDDCSEGADCASGLCLDVFNLCTAPCRSSADCDDSGVLFCGYAGVETADATTDYIPVCQPRGWYDGASRTGEVCDADADCYDYACVSGRCADACCSDSDCTAGTRCRAVAFGDAWLMYCVE